MSLFDPSYEAIKLAEKISDMSKEGKKSVHLILYKVDDKLAEKIIAKVGKGRVIGVIPFSKCVQKKSLTGKALDLKMPGIDDVVNFTLNVLQGIINSDD